MASVSNAESSQIASRRIISAAAQDTVPWAEIEVDARELANALRSKDESDLHSALGKEALPASIVKLLNNGFEKGLPQQPVALASFELLRLTANLCMDHDANRQQFLDANFHESALSLLQGYISVQNLTLDALKVAKTAIGALLNSCYSFAPARSHLISLKAPNTILCVSQALYPPARWPTKSTEEESLETLISSYQIRSGLSDWSWRLLSAIAEEAEASTLGPESLEPLLFTLGGFIPTQKPSSPLVEHAESRKALINADVESLEECVTLLEGLSLDSEEIRMRFADSLSHPAEQSLILQLVDFIEGADYPEYWNLDGEEERKQREKSFDTCKAGTIKALVSIAGETKAMDTFWGNGEILVKRMVKWILTDTDSSKRDDLIIAGCLTLGNLARKDAYCESLVQGPYKLLPSLIPLLTVEADIKVKHAVAGLLKNLAQASSNRRPLGQSGILEQFTRSQVWGEGCDMAETVQVSAIGVAKHLCNGDVDNTLRLVSGDAPTGTDQIVALVRRSDSVIVKSEGTRVLAYCVKSMWKKDPPANAPADFDSRRRQAIDALCQEKIIKALANLLVEGHKHVILLSESTLALSLIASKAATATTVYPALTAGDAPEDAADTKDAAPANGIAMLKAIITNESGKYPPELRANACSLIGTLARNLSEDKKSQEELANSYQDILKTALETKDVPDKLSQAAKWAQESLTWTK
ncbi:hypothetical protein M408DRAFT_329123 [Serendipita vermifera MAFF 305830]|uniref:Uncharacterized protein n=1 Tax=Serendipita vermifera MAFF 305830 TaxID=933852 RepID=A0A0C2XJ89_SERVB|nr:hypothetical protein M408DRAFT_329123 [Serendipita vermifera MAFF 305830]